MVEPLLARCVAIVSLLILVGADQTDTDRSRKTPLPAPAAFLTTNKCDDSHPLLLAPEAPYDVSTLPDCGCPSGYTALLLEYERTVGGSTLCAALWSPGPSHEGCIAAGTTTDYYDLPMGERRWVRDLLLELGVSEFWISARMLTPQGPLVRRLPGASWNRPLLVSSIQRQHLELDLNAPNVDCGDCAAVGGPDYERIFLANCSRALPLLCLVRLPSLLQLNCRKGELTTRYRDSTVQQQCYAVLPMKDRDRYPLADYRLFVVDSARRAQLLHDLLGRASKNGKGCRTPYYIDVTKGESPAGASLTELPVGVEKSHNCLVVQRDACDGLPEWTGTGVPPAMHLYFDQERHKLLLTVYGQRWFWREKQSNPGFTCYTDAGSDLINPVRVRTVRGYGKARARQRRAHPRGNPTPSTEREPDEESALELTERSLYELTLVAGQPGQYWCEAHLLPNFTHLVTPATHAYRKVEGRVFFAITLDARTPEAMRPKEYRALVKDTLKRHRHLAKVKDVYGALKDMQVRQAIPLRDRTVGQPAIGQQSEIPVRLVLHLAMARIENWSHFTGAWEYEENVIALPEPYLAIYRMRQCLRDAFEMVASSNSSDAAPFRVLGVNSTEYCLPDRLSGPSAHGHVWWTARLGETIAPQNLCVVERLGLPPTRHCQGDYLYGCAWNHNDDDRQQPATGPNRRLQCAPIQPTTTGALYQYSAAPLNDTQTVREALGTIEQVLSGSATLIPADLFYIAKTLDNARDGLLLPALLTDPQLYCNITAIMSRIMYVNDSLVTVSQRALNTTNILLYATETIVNQLLPETLVTGSVARSLRYDCEQDRSRYGIQSLAETATEHGGTVVFRSARLIVLIADPTVANVSGVALFRVASGASDDDPAAKEEHHGEDDFTNYTLKFLYANQSQEALLEDEGLEIGAFIPQSVLEGLATLYSAMQHTTIEEEQEDIANEKQQEEEKEEQEEEEEMEEIGTTTERLVVTASPPPPVRIVITIYYNDRAFRETRNGTIARPNAKIISVSLPGYGSRMPDEIPIFTREHRASSQRNETGRCGYWSFERRDREFGRWAYEECRLRGESGVRKLCACYHLTSFSRLTMDTQLVESVGVSQKLIADQASYALDVITAIGCSLSLLGVAGIVATALLFPSWRSKASSKILLQLSGAIAIEMIILFVEGPDIDVRRISRIECALLGSTLHYIILVTFLWMLVTAYLQFQRYVKVVGRLRPAHFILKATTLCWGLPLVPVATFLAVDHALYLKRDNLSDICYPHGAALWYGLLLPIAVIILLNFVSFVVVLYHICTIRTERNRPTVAAVATGKVTEHDLTLAQLRLSVFLFFLLGLPWIFGMLTTGTEEKLFAYLFCLTAPVQGFVLFLYFVVMDPVARRLWLVRLHRWALLTSGRSQQKDGNHTDMEKETTATRSTSLNTQL